MKKPLKIILLALAALIVLLVAAVAVITMVIDPNDYKPQIAELVEKNTGFKVEFNGPLELKVFPRLAVSARKVAVISDPSFGGAPLLDLEQASLNMALLPLLGGRLEVNSVLLSGARISLVTDAGGRNNWEMTPGRESGVKTEPTTQTERDGGKAGEGGKISGEIGTLKIEKSVLNYKNLKSGQDVSLLINSLGLENISLGKDTELALDAVLNDKGTASTVSVKIGGKANLSANMDRLALDLPKVNMIVKSPQVPEPQSVDGSLKADLSLRDFVGDLALALNNPNLELKLDAKSAGAVYGADALPKVAGNLRLVSKPAKLLPLLGVTLTTADPGALEAFNLEASFSLGEQSKNELTLASLKGNLDATGISGSLKAKLPGAAGLPSGVDYSADAVLKLDEINIDNYLPPQKDAGTTSAQDKSSGQGAVNSDTPGQSAQAVPAVKGPLKDGPLEKAVVNVSLSLGKATVKKIPMQDLLAGLTLNRGKLKLDKFSLKTLDGVVNAEADADLLRANPPVSAKATAAGIDLESALKILAGSDKLSGKADLNLNLNFSGLDYPSIARTLGGNGKFSVSGGKIQHFQLIPEDATAALLQFRQDDYPFDNASASFNASNGVISNKDLLLTSPKLGVTGSGTVDLGKNNIDYRARITLPKEKGEPVIPVRIHGSLDNIQYGLDLEELARTAGKDAVKTVIQDLQDKGKIPAIDGDGGKKIEEGVKGLLKGLKK